ncbi:hypothetical protein HK101_010027 [Irineochytrium annulatum]|nr:hypothetical protein HK101_010027 [Irineochytrium annulatum]
MADTNPPNDPPNDHGPANLDWTPTDGTSDYFESLQARVVPADVERKIKDDYQRYRTAPFSPTITAARRQRLRAKILQYMQVLMCALRYARDDWSFGRLVDEVRTAPDLLELASKLRIALYRVHSTGGTPPPRLSCPSEAVLEEMTLDPPSTQATRRPPPGVVDSTSTSGSSTPRSKKMKQQVKDRDVCCVLTHAYPIGKVDGVVPKFSKPCEVAHIVGKSLQGDNDSIQLLRNWFSWPITEESIDTVDNAILLGSDSHDTAATCHHTTYGIT